MPPEWVFYNRGISWSKLLSAAINLELVEVTNWCQILQTVVEFGIENIKCFLQERDFQKAPIKVDILPGIY